MVDWSERSDVYRVCCRFYFCMLLAKVCRDSVSVKGCCFFTAVAEETRLNRLYFIYISCKEFYFQPCFQMYVFLQLAEGSGLWLLHRLFAQVKKLNPSKLQKRF